LWRGDPLVRDSPNLQHARQHRCHQQQSGLDPALTDNTKPNQHTPSHQLNLASCQVSPHHPYGPLAITDEASPLDLRSTRNRPRRAMHQGATPFFARPVTTGDPEAFVHGVRPSSVSNLSAQPPRFAMRSLVWPSQPRLLSWGDVVWSMVLESCVWGPHSLHTAEATGSKPVTPTSTNRFLSLLPAPSCQQIASKPP
jgi:hypothetical protein